MRYDVITRWDSAYMMLSRALYLRKAIDHFVLDDDDELQHLWLQENEWQMCELLVTILLPFKKASHTLQTTSRPAIDEVFWTYEMLFNKIDKLKSTFNLPQYKDEEWAQDVHEAVDHMALKLWKHYDLTARPFVYPDSVILEPCGKLILFKQQTWDMHYTEQYRIACRKRYVDQYESSTLLNGALADNPPTKKWRLADIEDAQNDYRAALHQLATSHVMQNEYDRYLELPAAATLNTLKWWKEHQSLLPHLSRMARDTFAVPATGAGVERQFSKSGRVAIWGRALLKPDTVCEVMRYKDYLSRTGRPLTQKKRGQEILDHERTVEGKDAVDAEEEEDTIRMLEWEQEWWQKADARLVI